VVANYHVEKVNHVVFKFQVKNNIIGIAVDYKMDNKVDCFILTCEFRQSKVDLLTVLKFNLDKFDKQKTLNPIL
jgi:hypothetical protein